MTDELDTTPLYIRENADYDAAIASIDATCEAYFREREKQADEKHVCEYSDLLSYVPTPLIPVVLALFFPFGMLRFLTNK